MRRSTMLIALILSLVIASSPVSAQKTPVADFGDVNVAAVADSTLTADLDDLINGLTEPMIDSELPERFSSAEYVDPVEVTDDDLVLPMEDIGFAVGSAGFNVHYKPEVGGFGFGMASLNYIVIGDEITRQDLDDFRDGAENDDVTVEDIEVNGVRGLLVSVDLEEDDVISIVRLIVLPVGNTMVMSMVVAASSDLTLDSATIRSDAENLLLAGIVYLGIIAAGAQ